MMIIEIEDGDYESEEEREDECGAFPYERDCDYTMGSGDVEEERCISCGRAIRFGEKFVRSDDGALCFDCLEEMTLSDLLFFLGFTDTIDLLEEYTDLVVKL